MHTSIVILNRVPREIRLGSKWLAASFSHKPLVPIQQRCSMDLSGRSEQVYPHFFFTENFSVTDCTVQSADILPASVKQNSSSNSRSFLLKELAERRSILSDLIGWLSVELSARYENRFRKCSPNISLPDPDSGFPGPLTQKSWAAFSHWTSVSTRSKFQFRFPMPNEKLTFWSLERRKRGISPNKDLPLDLPLDLKSFWWNRTGGEKWSKRLGKQFLILNWAKRFKSLKQKICKNANQTTKILSLLICWRVSRPCAACVPR